MTKLLTGIQYLHTHGVGGKLKTVRDAALLLKGSTILWVGTRKEGLRKFRTAKLQELNAQTVLPAFLDCHTHTVFAGSRKDEFEKRNAGMTYQQIASAGGGIRSTVAATRKASLKTLTDLAETRCQKFLEQGVATVEIKSGYGLTLQDELKILKAVHRIKSVRTVPTFLGPHAVPSEYKSADAYLQEVLSWLPRIAKLCRRADIFIEQGYFSADQAEDYFRALKDLHFDVVAHCEQLSQSGGITKAIQYQAVSVDHCVHASDQQIQQLATSATTAVLLPTSDFYLKINYPPARKMLDSGVSVALATDFNPGSSPTQSINFVGVLARLHMSMTQEEVIRALTYSAAKALGLDHQLGSLEPGKSADFVVFDGLLEDLFYEVGHHPVRCVWRSGRQVYFKKS